MSVLGGLVSQVKLFSRSSAVLSAVVTPVAIAILWILLLSLDAKLKHKPGIRQNVDDGHSDTWCSLQLHVMYLVQFSPFLCFTILLCSCTVVLCCRMRARNGEAVFLQKEKVTRRMVRTEVEWISYHSSIYLVVHVHVYLFTLGILHPRLMKPAGHHVSALH